MMPQVPELNRGVWGDLEEYCRELVQQGKDLYISGGAGGESGRDRRRAGGESGRDRQKGKDCSAG